MGIGFKDNVSKYDGAIDFILSAITNPFMIGYFGTPVTPDSTRLGAFNNTAKAGLFSLIGDAALGTVKGIHIPLNGAAGSRVVSPVNNTGTSGTIMLTFNTGNSGGQILTWGGGRLRIRSDGNIAWQSQGSERLATGGVQDATKSICLSLTAADSAFRFDVYNVDGSIKFTFSLNYSDGTKWIVDNSVLYFGGSAISTNIVGVDVFAPIAFNRALTASECSAQAAQLIAYSNYIGAGIV